ncbi:MAG: hypothetical protein U0744_06330 [Gemmataceae bacterium]
MTSLAGIQESFGKALTPPPPRKLAGLRLSESTVERTVSPPAGWAV